MALVSPLQPLANANLPPTAALTRDDLNSAFRTQKPSPISLHQICPSRRSGRHDTSQSEALPHGPKMAQAGPPRCVAAIAAIHPAIVLPHKACNTLVSTGTGRTNAARRPLCSTLLRFLGTFCMAHRVWSLETRRLHLISALLSIEQTPIFFRAMWFLFQIRRDVFWWLSDSGNHAPAHRDPSPAS